MNWPANRTFKMSPRVWTGTAAPVAFVSVLLIVTAFGSAWYIRSMQKSVADMLANNVASVRAAQELELGVRDLRTQVDRYLVSGDTAHLESVPALRQRAEEALDDALQLANTTPEQALMRRTRLGLQSFFNQYDHMTEGNPKRADYSKTLRLIDSVLNQEVLEPTREYLRINEGMLTKANEENQRVAMRLTAGLVGLALCGAIGGLLGGWVISSALRKNMLQAEERLRSTARQLDVAARTAEVAASRGGRTVDALDDVAKSATAVLARLRRTEQEALRAEQLAWAGQMAAGIAHEVRNPLMAIKLLIQALADGRGGKAFRPRDMEVLEEEILRLEQIINSFLDFARPPLPDKQPIDIAGLLDQVAAGIKRRADLQSVRVEMRAERRPLTVEADANQLRQLFYNLAFNALDAQPHGGMLRFSAILAGEGPEPKSVAIRVEDRGPGLPPELRQTIFDPFVSTKESGMGLGLSICRRIVECHGGEIEAGERTEGGAVFTVTIPLVTERGSTPLDADSNAELPQRTPVPQPPESYEESNAETAASGR